MAIPRILIVEDDGDWLEIYRRLLIHKEYDIVAVRNLQTARTILKQQPFDIVLTDLRMLGGHEEFSGFGILNEAKTTNPNIQVIVITGYGSVEHALRAIGSGAYDFITKDGKLRSKLPLTIQTALEIQSLKLEMLGSRVKDDILPESDRILGNSKSMIALSGEITHASSYSINVLIKGESGTGKRLIAQTIHRQSSRKNASFFVIDCKVLSALQLKNELFGHTTEAGNTKQPGKLERANQGTIFFDGINHLDAQTQSKLVSILSNKEIIPFGEHIPINLDVRIIASINKVADVLLETNQLYQSLYDLINEIEIAVSPLRQRNDKDDILLLAAMFLQRYSDNTSSVFSSEVISLLNQYNYPGNVGELEKIIKQSLTLCNGSIIKPEHLNDEVRYFGKQSNGKDKNSSSQIDLRNLRKNLNKSFNISELREISFDLNIAYDDLSGTGKSDKVIELLSYLERRDELDKLIFICRELRPNVKWET